MVKANFELIFRAETENFSKETENKIKEFNHCLSKYPAKSITEVYDRTEPDAEVVYTKINDVGCSDGDKCKCTIAVVGMEEEPKEISLKEFRSKLRKFYTSRMKSTEFDLGTITLDNNEIIKFSVRFFRDFAKVVIATAEFSDNVEVTSDVMKRIKDEFGNKLPNFIRGRITEATFTKISLVNESHYIPYRKLVPYFADFTKCKKLSSYLCEYNKEIAEYKWLRTKTGLVIVRCHNGEMTNIMTNNKIHSDYVVEECIAFDIHTLRMVSNDKGMEYTTAKDIADRVINRVEVGIITKNDFNIRFKNLNEKRFRWIENYEEMRKAKRSLANMGV